MKKYINISTTKIKSKKTGNEINCVKLEIGKYSTLIFPNPVEYDYLENFIKSYNIDDSSEDLVEDEL